MDKIKTNIIEETNVKYKKEHDKLVNTKYLNDNLLFLYIQIIK